MAAWRRRILSVLCTLSQTEGELQGTRGSRGHAAVGKGEEPIYIAHGKLRNLAYERDADCEGGGSNAHKP